MSLFLSTRFSVIAIITVHFFGLIGLQTAYADWFLLLTPLNLMLSVGLLLLHHKHWKFGIGWFLLAAFSVGFGVEVLGVQTGFPFGNYVYGETLGPKVAGVPLVIGLNWVMLTYCAGIIVAPIKAHLVVKAMLAATLMVLLDFLIEPIAPVLDFWSWEQHLIPWENYLAWWVVAFALGLLFQRLRFAKDNRLAGALFLVQVVFFGILNFIY